MIHKTHSSTNGGPANFRQRAACPLCGSARNDSLIRESFLHGSVFDHVKGYYSNKGVFEEDYLTGAEYIVLECSECGFIYQEWVPTEDFLKRLYGTWVDANAAAERNQLNLGSNAKQYVQEQLLLRFWANGRKLKVLDYGMGHGRWCEMAIAFGHDCFGYEFENERVHRSLKKGLIECISYSEIPSHKFDFINAEQVFEHLTEPVEVLQHIASAVREGGLVRVSVPSGLKIKRNLRKRGELDFSKKAKYGLNPIEPLQHLNCFTPDTLEKLGERGGLKKFRFPLYQIIASQIDWSFPRSFLRNMIHPVYNRLRYQDGMAQYFTRIHCV